MAEDGSKEFGVTFLHICGGMNNTNTIWVSTFKTIDQWKDVVDQPRDRSYLDSAQPYSFFHPGDQVYALAKVWHAIEGVEVLPRFACQCTETDPSLQCRLLS